MKRKTGIKTLPGAALLAGLVLSGAPVMAANEAMLDLLEVLRDKGSISQDEYSMLRNAALAEAEKSESADSDLKREMEETTASMENAGWANKVKLKGDIRLRYQYQDEDGSISRDRGRVRYRLGVIGRPFDRLEIGAGLASGSDDQRSTNQSFDESFSTKGIGLDYAYAEYEFTDNFKAVGGKFKYKNYLWTPTDLIWDSDINPEGASGSFTVKNRLGAAFFNSGVWVLEENSGSHDDPYLMYGQIGQKWQRGDLFGTVSGTYYAFQDITSLAVLEAPDNPGSNTDFRFDSFGLSGELGMKNLLGEGSKASIIADFIRNTDTGSPENTGYALGLKAARSKWGFKYIYADLEANAWPDFLPDSDRFDGLTGIRGHEIAVSYAILKNVEFGLDFYAVEDTVNNIDQELLQADVVIKF